MLVKFTGLWKKEIEVRDDMKVGALKNMVAEATGKGIHSFLVVAKGKKLTDKFDDKTLMEMKFKVRKSGKLVCIVMKQKGVAKIQQDEEKKIEESGPCKAIIATNPVTSSQANDVDIQRILRTAEKLAKENDDGIGYHANYFLEIMDSSGKKVFFPQKDREAISLGLTLHEKGKEYRKMGRGMWGTALELFLLSFKALNSVEKKFICMIDNFPILCLDIVWMYYRMNDAKNLKEAYLYLQEAEKGFERAYGKKLERLQAFRNNEYCPEQVLLIRLKILQALNAYYQGDIRRAENVLLLAQVDLRKLSVSDQHVAQIVSIGFNQSQARKALRVNKNKFEESVAYLLELQDTRIREEEKENKRLAKRDRARRYGLTKDKKLLDVDLLDGLKNSEIANHITEKLIVEAIREACNDREKTLDLILNPSSLRRLEKIMIEREKKMKERRLRRAQIRQVRDAGFSKAEASQALDSCGWNPDLAINILKMGSITRLGYKLEEARSALKKTNYNVESALALLLKSNAKESQPGVTASTQMDIDLIPTDEKDCQSGVTASTEMDIDLSPTDEKEVSPQQAAASTATDDFEEKKSISSNIPPLLEIAKQMQAVAARIENDEANDRDYREDTPSERDDLERGSRLNMDLVKTAIENAEDPDSHLDSDLVAEANAIEELMAVLTATRRTA